MMKMMRMEPLWALGSERVGAGLQEWEGPEGRYLKGQYALRVLRSSSAQVFLSLTHVTGSGRLRLYLSGLHDVTVTRCGGTQQCRPADAQNLAVLRRGSMVVFVT